MKKLLKANEVRNKRGMILNDTEKVDDCCRSLYKCNSYKEYELNQTFNWNVQHCDCINAFQMCLNENINTSLSNEIALLHSINVTKCFSKDYPIIICQRFQSIPNYVKLQFFDYMNFFEREIYFKRCAEYALDKSRPKELQIFDVLFNRPFTSTV